jgi:hypothetical protein
MGLSESLTFARLHHRFAGLALLLLAACSAADSPQISSSVHPNLFLNESEIHELRTRLAAREAPWQAAYEALIRRADAALSQRPGSVTHNGGGRVWRTQQPYFTDGVYNPNADRQDYIVGDRIADSILDLGLAYRLADQARYADKAVELIRVWFLRTATSLRAGTGSGNEIEIWITMPAAFYGIDLLWHYPGFPDADKAALQRWARASAERIHGLRRENNWENWRLVYLMTLAHTAGDRGTMEHAIAQWRSLLESQIGENGLLTQELDRTRSLDYSIFALDAMAQGAEIARHYGVDLYGYRNSRGQGLRDVFDAYAPYLLQPASWPYEQISDFDGIGNGIAVYELAYRHYGRKATYRSVIEAYRRPLIDPRTMGHVTLTHGEPLRESSTVTWRSE